MLKVPKPNLGQKKFLLPAVAGFFVLAGILSAAFGPAARRSTLTAFPQAGHERTSDAVGSALPAMGLNRLDARGASHLFEAQPEETGSADNEISLQDFMGLLDRRVPKPIAQKFVKEFMKKPELKEAWDVYKQVRGPYAPAREFVDFIHRVPQFRELMTKMEAEAGVKQAKSDLVRNTEVNRVVRAGLRNFTRDMAPAEAAIAREWEHKAYSGVDSTARGVSAGPGAHEYAPTVAGMQGVNAGAITIGAGHMIAGGQAAVSGDGRATQVGGSGEGGSASGGGAGGGSSGTGLKPTEKAGAGEYAVTKLETGYNAPNKGRIDSGVDLQSDTAVNSGKFNSQSTGFHLEAFLKWFDNQVPKSTYLGYQKTLRDNLGTTSNGLWGTCYLHDIYSVCRQAAGDLGMPFPPTTYAACLVDGPRSDIQCVQDCLTGSHACSKNDLTENNWSAACGLSATYGEAAKSCSWKSDCASGTGLGSSRAQCANSFAWDTGCRVHPRVSCGKGCTMCPQLTGSLGGVSQQNNTTAANALKNSVPKTGLVTPSCAPPYTKCVSQVSSCPAGQKCVVVATNLPKGTSSPPCLNGAGPLQKGQSYCGGSYTSSAPPKLSYTPSSDAFNTGDFVGIVAGKTASLLTGCAMSAACDNALVNAAQQTGHDIANGNYGKAVKDVTKAVGNAVDSVKKTVNNTVATVGHFVTSLFGG